MEDIVDDELDLSDETSGQREVQRYQE